jgi:hypothetical protein
MSALPSWELPDHVATVIGMPVAIAVLFSGQNNARDNMKTGLCRLYSGSYSGDGQEFTANSP